MNLQATLVIALLATASSCVVSTTDSIYLACSRGDMCTGARSTATACYTVSTQDTTGRGIVGSHCSKQCVADTDCPARDGFGARCFELNGDPNGAKSCYLSCRTDVDCPLSLKCYDAVNTTGAGVGKVCLPVNGLAPGLLRDGG